MKKEKKAKSYVVKNVSNNISLPKLLYLHGLDGSLSQEKRDVLERHFSVIAPQLDYRNTPDIFRQLSKLVIKTKPETIIGNSMGGCLAYYLAIKHQLPALCFNPAFVYRPIEIQLPDLETGNNPIVFVIGGRDVIVPAARNFAWIRLNANPNFVLKWYNNIGHRIDVETFAKEIELFRNSFFQKKLTSDIAWQRCPLLLPQID